MMMDEFSIKKKSSYVMMALNLDRKKLLIIGGGPVAYKRFLQWQYRGAEIHLVAPEFCDAFVQDNSKENDQVIFHERIFQAEDLEGVWMVYIATNDPVLNGSVEGLCRQNGILCGRGDALEPDVQSVAMIERGAIQIGISTSGKAPASVAQMKEAIEAAINLEEIEKKIDLMQKLKLRLKSEIPDQAQRAQLLKKAAKLSLVELENLLLRE